MFAPAVQALSAFFNDYLLVYVPRGLEITLATGFIEGGKYFKSYRHEFIGTLLMIGFTFSAGKWIGATDRNTAWIAHAIGVVCADYFAGGPQVSNDEDECNCFHRSTRTVDRVPRPVDKRLISQ
jgi:hypothetical protein